MAAYGTWTCGTCGRSWDYGTPAGRCPFEYEHEQPSTTIHFGVLHIHSRWTLRLDWLVEEGFETDGDSFDEWGEDDIYAPLHVTWTTDDEVTPAVFESVRDTLVGLLHVDMRLADYAILTDGEDYSQNPRIAAVWALNRRIWNLTH